MKQRAQSRELIELEGQNTTVRGTWHKTRDESSGTDSSFAGRGRLGVVVLNSMSPTRAAYGDSAVHLADGLAECGYPVFRLDLPGFGDSEGDPPQDLLGFVNCGGFAAIVSAKISELAVRFQLKDVIVLGHCGGAVSAIFAASGCKECRGLILMAPYFHLPQIVRSKARQQLSLWALRSQVGGRFSNAFDKLKALRLKWRRAKVPQNANRPLLRAWKEVASTGLSILVAVAPDRKAAGVKPRLGEFDYIAHILGLAGEKGRVTVRSADGADHSFSNRLGRTAIQEIIGNWLSQNFPRHSQGPAVTEQMSSQCNASYAAL